MNLRKITKLTELTQFTPKLLELHSSLDGKWEPDLTSEEFLLALVDNFASGSCFFGDIVDEEIAYFAVLIPQTDTRALFWLFYMNPRRRAVTKEILNQLKDYMRTEGFTTIYSQSTRTAGSYERWLEKFGAEKVAIVYKFKL